MMRATPLLWLVAWSLCLAACARHVKPDLLSIDDVIEARQSFDNRNIAVTGYIVLDLFGDAHFVKDVGRPSGDRVTRSIDIIPVSKHIEEDLAKFDGRCVVLDGKFSVYGLGTIRTGDLVSEYGYLDVRGARSCSD